ncbi:MAG: DMT family transporter [Clostridia bacterium]|nr:DMT family transporter [Clostridia bacterium]
MNHKQLGGTLMLLLTAFIWGVAFVAQDKGAAYVGSFTFQALRSLLATVLLTLLCMVRNGWAGKKGTYTPPSKEGRRTLLWGGIACGVLLCTASLLQQFGIANNTSSPGKDAFITALYIVFVPILGLLFGKRSQPHVYACVVVALVGLWMLCMGGSGITTGDIQVILCSLAFSFHIMLVDHIAPRVDGVRLSCIQFCTVTVISGVCMLLFERPTWENILAAMGSIVFAGVLSSAGGYTLQILGQKHTPPTVACLVMSLESVFAVIASMIFLPEVPAPTAREWIGMVLIFVGIIVSQLPLRYGKKKKEAQTCSDEQNQEEI